MLKKFQLKNWSIRAKVMIIIVVLIFSLVAVLFMSRQMSEGSSKLYGDYNKSMLSLNTSIKSLDGDVFRFLRYDIDNLDFYSNGTTEHLMSFDNHLKVARTIIEDLSHSVDVSELSGLLSQYEQTVMEIKEKAYDTGYMGFGKIVELSTEMTGINNALNSLKEPEILQYLLTIKKYEASYLSEKDRKIGTLLSISVNDIHQTLKKPKYADFDSTELKEKTESYKAKLLEIVDNNERLFELEEQLSQLSDAIVISSNTITDNLHGVMSESQGRQQILLLSFVLIVGGISVVIALFVSRHISKSIEELKHRFYNISDGEGDLTQRLEVKSNEEIGQLSSNFNRFVHQIESLIKVVQTDARDVNTSSNYINECVTNVKEGVEIINDEVGVIISGIQENAAVIEEVNEFLSDISSYSSQINAQTDRAVIDTSQILSMSSEGIDRLNQMITHVLQLDDSMLATSNMLEQLSRSSDEIFTIVDMIKKITSQTSLLAINASIEAAQAGAYGYGFNVVAGEIKKLAEDSKASTHQIQHMIKDITEQVSSFQGKVKDDMALIRMTTKDGQMTLEDFGHILKCIHALNEQMGSISDATGKQMSLNDAIKTSLSTVSEQVQHTVFHSETIGQSILDQNHAISNIHDTMNGLQNKSNDLLGITERFKVS